MSRTRMLEKETVFLIMEPEKYRGKDRRHREVPCTRKLEKGGGGKEMGKELEARAEAPAKEE